MAEAADRRSSNAGQMEATQAGCVSRDSARFGGKERWEPHNRKGGRGEGAVMASSSGSPPVADEGVSEGGMRPGKGWEEELRLGDCAGSSAVAVQSGGGSDDSQKVTARPPTTLARGRPAAMARHSAAVAVVMSSPFQAAGMRVPVAVHPGHEPRWA